MRKLTRFLLITIAAVFVTAACSAPTGAIDYDPHRVTGDDALWAIPNRLFYDLDERNGEFDRNTDLQVFTSVRGAIQLVPIHLPQIFIVENPGTSGERRMALDSNGRYLFRTPGIKHVEIHYRGMMTWYAVEVRGRLFSSDDDFANIIWF